MLESLVDSSYPPCSKLISAQTEILAASLQSLISAAWAKAGGKSKKKDAGDKLPAAGRHAAMRALAILERVVDGIETASDAAHKLTEALLVPLQQLASSTRSACFEPEKIDQTKEKMGFY